MVASLEPELWVVADSEELATGFKRLIKAEESTWRIDNKYYTATASIRFIDASPGPSLPSATATALALVCRADSAASFRAARDWFSSAAGQASDAISDEGSVAEIQLCLFDVARGSEACGEWLRGAVDFCHESGIEPVFVSSEDSGLDDVLGSDQGAAVSDRLASYADALPEVFADSQGSRRVVAALQAHQWPGLTLKPRPTVAYPARPLAADLESDDAARSGDGAAGAVGRGYQPPDLGLEGSGAGAGAGGAARGAAAGREADGAVHEVAEWEEGEGPRIGEEEDPDTEADINGLELLMAQLFQFREQSAGLTPEQRREASAQMAFRLLRELGGEDEEEGVEGSAEEAEESETVPE